MPKRRFGKPAWQGQPTPRPDQEALRKADELIGKYSSAVEFIRGEPIMITAGKEMHYPLACRLSEKIASNDLLNDRQALILGFPELVSIINGGDFERKMALGKCHLLVTDFSAKVQGYGQEDVLHAVRGMKGFREGSFDKSMDGMNRHYLFTERDFRHDLFLPYLYNDEATPLDGPAMTGLPYPFINYMHFGHIVEGRFKLYHPQRLTRGEKLSDN